MCNEDCELQRMRMKRIKARQQAKANTDKQVKRIVVAKKSQIKYKLKTRDEKYDPPADYNGSLRELRLLRRNERKEIQSKFSKSNDTISEMSIVDLKNLVKHAIMRIEIDGAHAYTCGYRFCPFKDCLENIPHEFKYDDFPFCDCHNYQLKSRLRQLNFSSFDDYTSWICKPLNRAVSKVTMPKPMPPTVPHLKCAELGCNELNDGFGNIFCKKHRIERGECLCCSGPFVAPNDSFCYWHNSYNI